MFKKIFIFSLFLFLTNCGTPGVALLGPAFTGVTTKSAAKAGVSYSSNKIMKKMVNKPTDKKNKNLFNFSN